MACKLGQFVLAAFGRLSEMVICHIDVLINYL